MKISGRAAKPANVIRALTFASGSALAVSLMACLVAGRAMAASPSVDPGAGSAYEVWLDSAPAADAVPGTMIPIGATIWNRQRGALDSINGAYVKLYPASGKAKPSVAVSQIDWPGHLLAVVAVPRGGAGRVEIGTTGQSCTAAGVCTEVGAPFALGGIGPPPEARRADLVIPEVIMPRDPVVAGSPFSISVRLVPRGNWEPALLGLSNRLVVLVNHPRGPDLAQAELRLGADPGTYSGSLTIPEGGPVVMTAAFPINGSEDQVIASSATRITVLPGSGEVASTAPGATDAAGNPGAPIPAPGADLNGLVPWLAGVLGLVAVGLVIRRAFADL